MKEFFQFRPERSSNSLSNSGMYYCKESRPKVKYYQELKNLTENLYKQMA